MQNWKEIDNHAQKNDIVNPLPIIRQNTLTKFLKRCWVILAFLIITAAVISSLFRALTPWAKQYKTEVEQQLSLVLGQKVTINAMETGWYWFEPVVKLNQISISDGKQVAVQLSKLLIGIDILSSLWHWQIQPGILLIEDLNLRLHQQNGYWQVDGIDGLDNHKLNWNPTTYQPILAWILGQQKIIIKNLSAHVYMQDGTLIPLTELNLNIANRSGHYYIKGRGSLEQATPTNFQLLADLILDPYALNKTTGQIFFAVQHLVPLQWLGFAPQARFQPQDGQGNLQLWADITKGQLKLVQAKLRFRHLAWFDRQTQKKQSIRTFKANLAWKPTEEGWQLAGDQVRLGIDKTTWPENSFLIRYRNVNEAYFVFVKNILLEPLLKSSLIWPEALTTILAAKPHGHFYDTQIQFKPAGIDSILTRFSDLGWQEFNKKPGMDNLSGALYWQPKEGQLELAGEKILISPKKQKPIMLSALDTAFNWRQENDGLRINLERFIVNHPNLLVNAKGLVDKISNNSPSQLNLKAEFSGSNAQYLLPYVPGKHLKPKFEAWLKKDVKRISNLSGELVVNGALADFPFDKQPGTFTVNTHFNGLDLAFARNWPLARDLDVYMRVDKRNMEADILNSNIQGIISHNSTIRIDDIGLDKEVLLYRTQTEAKAAKLLSILMASPLNKKLSALSILKMQGLLKLDLKLEAPLYPENNTILAVGDINFQNNQVSVHHSLDEIELNNLTGFLQFNQAGILNSNLKTTILNCPANLIVKSIHEPISYTEVKIAGQATAEALSKKLNLPVFALMHGSLWVQSTLKLTDDPKALAHLNVQSSLAGLGIDLPPPLGKAAETETPITLDVDFNSQKVRMRLNYDNRLSSDLSFSSSKDLFELKEGEIRLGSADSKLKHSRPGLQLVGSLDSFDLQSWLDIKAKLPQIKVESRFMNALNLIDIKLLQAKIWKENYKDLDIKAAKAADDDWSIQFKEANLEAKLRYQQKTNTLTGEFDKLHIEKSLRSNKTNSTLQTKDIPNLDLHIASLQLGALDLGDVTLKTKSSTKLWRLEYCKIKTPSYLLDLKGEWSQDGKKNSTNLEATMQISDLAASLQRWKIFPAVEAKQGGIQFQGGWAGALTDFQLAKLKGQVNIEFKNGRITNLSPETEEKLGLGKLLSILSLQTIPRRLKLDFSDLAKTGYSFDKFQGNFDLSKGIMTTQDSYIDGPVAYASMKGNLDIAKQKYDVDLRISPHITASLPLVATIAGGPIVGFATLVASKIINQGMHNISGYTYKVTGPWQQPVVEQVSIKKRRIPLRG
ncbi:MAG: TIGR02099 family protein [Tatlockia sp.]|nr:TIGR02099 family protein [Tatlockia sp.]